MTALYDRDRPTARGTRPGHRPRDHRADPHPPRHAADGLRPARHRSSSRTGNRSVNNAPRNTYQTARRPVGRHLHVGAVHRRARHGAGRSPRGHRRAVVRSRRASGPQHADQLDEMSAAGSASATCDEVVDRVRGGRRRRRADLRHRRRVRRPAVPGARQHHDRRGPGPRAGPDAERAVPPLGDAGIDPVDRAPERRRQRVRCSRSASDSTSRLAGLAADQIV